MATQRYCGMHVTLELRHNNSVVIYLVLLDIACDFPSPTRRHFDDIFVTGSTCSCHLNNFRYSKERKRRQADISVLV